MLLAAGTPPVICGLAHGGGVFDSTEPGGRAGENSREKESVHDYWESDHAYCIVLCCIAERERVDAGP